MIKLVGELPHFKSKVFLAPMAGLTDPAFRLLCSELGAGLTVTELTSVHSVIAKEKEIKDFVGYFEEERPRAVQIFGNDIEKSVKAAKILEKHFDIIDFNMGCPSSNITQQMAGAALLQEKEHVRELFRVLVKSVNVPVTLKMRTGINKPNLFLDIAKIAEEEGVKMITLHARTLKQGYSGKADWSLIKKLKESVSIPVCGNGDINTPEDAERMLKETGCDYVMIGRASKGNPLIFKLTNKLLKTGRYNNISNKEKIDYFLKYLEYTNKIQVKFSNIKIHALQYTKGIVNGSKIRSKMSRAKTIEEIKDIFRTIELED